MSKAKTIQISRRAPKIVYSAKKKLKDIPLSCKRAEMMWENRFW